MEMYELIAKIGGATAACLILIRGIAYLYKDMMNLYAQVREDSIKRDEELTKCFNKTVTILEGINTTMRDNNATMRDINTRLCIIERKVD